MHQCSLSRIVTVASVLAFLAIASPLTTGAQEASTVPTPSPSSTQSTTVEALEQLVRSLEAQSLDVERIRARMNEAENQSDAAALASSLEQRRRQLRAVEAQLEGSAVGVETGIFAAETDDGLDLKEEISKLLEPVIAELEAATADSRVVEELRSELELNRERAKVARQALDNLQRLNETEGLTEPLVQRLQSIRDEWERRLDNAEAQVVAAEEQLRVRLSQKRTVVDAAASLLETFVKERGLHLTLGLLAFCVVFFSLQLLGVWLQKAARLTEHKGFGIRIAALAYRLLTVVLALAATLVVFNVTGDWFLLGLTAIILIGFAWASINTLPRVFEQVRLALNLGSVREGERLEWNGVPWIVRSIGFRARLENPLLDGGTQWLPVVALVGQFSREPGKEEPLYPFQRGDWIELDDGQLGEVTCLTPSFTRLVPPGGSEITYRTTDLLGRQPRNLSVGARISVPFGLDYAHQAAITREIPERLQEAVRDGVLELIPDDHLRRVQVRFVQAGSSSLDVEALVDLEGAAAPRYRELERAIARAMVEASTANGWTIPFPQLTLHRADA